MLCSLLVSTLISFLVVAEVEEVESSLSLWPCDPGALFSCSSLCWTFSGVAFIGRLCSSCALAGGGVGVDGGEEGGDFSVVVLRGGGGSNVVSEGVGKAVVGEWGGEEDEEAELVAPMAWSVEMSIRPPAS